MQRLLKEMLPIVTLSLLRSDCRASSQKIIIDKERQKTKKLFSFMGKGITSE
jgi:hypothetical protein